MRPAADKNRMAVASDFSLGPKKKPTQSVHVSPEGTNLIYKT